jgi:hypothetical protein
VSNEIESPSNNEAPVENADSIDIWLRKDTQLERTEVLESCWRSSVELIERAELQRQRDVEALPASSGYLQWKKGLLDELALEIAPAKDLALTGNSGTELQCFGVGNLG